MNQNLRIEIVYSHKEWAISEARKILRKALLKVGKEVFWEEWKLKDQNLPERLKHSGQFALFINENLAYRTEKYMISVDELSQLIIKETTKLSTKDRIKQIPGKLNWALLSAFGVALIPKCPLCWAAYMGIFSGMGVSAVEYQPWLLPFMAISLVLSMIIAIYQGIRKKRFVYMWLILIGATLILFGKFVLNIDMFIYPGLAILAFAFIWLRYPFKVSGFSIRGYQKILSTFNQKK